MSSLELLLCTVALWFIFFILLFMVAMMFNLSDDRAAHDAMLLAAIITLFGAVLSLCRVGIRKNDV